MKPRSAPKYPEMRVSPPRGRLRRALLLLFAVAVVGLGAYSLAGFLGGPWLIDRWLEQYGAEGTGRTASRAMVRFNPFTLVGEIVGVELRDSEAGAAFSADRIVVDFAAQSLAELRPAASSLLIERPRIEFASVAELADFIRVARAAILDRARVGRLEMTDGAFTAGDDADPAFGLPQFELSLTAFDGMARDAADFSFDAVTSAGASVSLAGSLTADLERAEGRLQLDGLELGAVTSQLDGLIEAAKLSGRVSLTTEFSAQSLLGMPTLRFTEASLDFSGLALNPASTLTVSLDSAAATADLVFAAGDEGLDLSGRIETDDTQVTIRDARAMPPQSFVFDDAALLATADADGLALILGGRLRQAGNAALTVRAPPGPAARSISIEAFNVPAATLSAYASDAIGRRIAAGSADIRLEYALTDSRADGWLHLIAHDLAFAQRLAGADDGSLELAAALLEDSDGVIDIDLRFATNRGTVRDALAAALAARIGTVAETPFDALATLTDGQGQPANAVPFSPGDAALSDRALASVEALADALSARPRLGVRVYGAYDAAVDRDALARQQIELHVALATAGASPQARPAPVNFGSPRVQDVLDEFAGERLPADRIAAFAQRFVCEGALADVCERAYYEQIFSALVANEEIAPTTLSRLGRFRAQSVVDALRQRGISADRIELVTGNYVVETPFGIGLPVELTALETAARRAAPDSSLAGPSALRSAPRAADGESAR